MPAANGTEGLDTRTIAVLLIGVLAVLVVGTVGYVVIEGWTVLDSFYMTVLALSTVGFGEVRTLSPEGRLFTILLIIGGVSLIGYGLSRMIEFMVSGTLTGMYRRRTMRRRVAELRGHYIICGFGRVGEAVAWEFRAQGASFVVVDNNEETIARVQELGFLGVEGNASDDETLKEAGIDRARGLVAAVDSDAENIFVVLSARVLNPGLSIVARATADESVSKLRRAGANEVLSPYSIGGKKMATLMMRPLVSDYLEVVTGGGEIEFRLEELSLNETCEVVGRSIKELDIRNRTGATVLAIRRGRTGVFDTNPDPDVVLEARDVLIAIATPQDIGRLEELFACRLPARVADMYEERE